MKSSGSDDDESDQRIWRRIGALARLGCAAFVLAFAAPAAGAVSEESDAAISPPPTAAQRAAAFNALARKAQRNGQVPAIVGLAVPFVAEGDLPGKAAVTQQRAAIAAAQQNLVNDLTTRKTVIKRRFKYIPYVALRLDPPTLAYLATLPYVASIEEDALARPHLASTTQIVGTTLVQNYVYGFDFDGSGQTIAILDTGVDNDHPFLDEILEEACFSTNDIFGADSLCPNDGEEQFGTGSADNCSTSIDGCEHGTHVAGIAAGAGNTPGDFAADNPDLPSFSGIARAASLIAVQVFHRKTGSVCTDAGDASPCARTYKSDYVAGLEFVFGLRDEMDIAAVNMSLGSGRYDRQTTCANENRATESAVANLRSARIATVVSSGNDGFTDALSAPACLSNVISVGNTRDNDTVNGSSNSASFLTLLAPGTDVDSSVPGDTFASLTGTSMSAPHVAGAWAIMKEAFGNLRVRNIRDRLKNAGVAVTDSRNGITKKRLRIDAALPVELVGLSTAQPLRTILAGESATFTIKVTRVNYDGQVDLQLGQIPPGVTATLTPTTDVGATATLTLQTTVSTPSLGIKDIRVFASVFPVDEIPLDVRLVVSAPAPTVSGFSPQSGPAGTQVTINGTNLIGSMQVRFGGVASPDVTRVSSTETRALVPGTAVTGPVVVTTPGGTRQAPGVFTLTQGPSITGVSPLAGVKGDPVTITGFNLTGATALKFNGASALFTVVSATRIDTTVPIGASTGPITVTTPNGTGQSSTSFTIQSSTAAPSITSFSPTSGDEGTLITVNGSGFNGLLTVKIGNGTATQVTRVSSVKLKVRVPATATTGRISVSNPSGGAVSAVSFTRVFQ